MATRTLLALAAALSLSATAAAADTTLRGPVLVELFTSQGCAGCPEANDLVRDLESRHAHAVALTYAVPYWDYLGWRDTFARPEFAERQKAYAAGLNKRRVSTPQIVIDGRVVSPAEAPSAKIAATSRGAVGAPVVRTSLDRGQLSVSVGDGRVASRPAEVWIAEYRPGPMNVPVRAGDNAGRVVAHHNVVERLTLAGRWNGAARVYTGRCAPACVVIVQEPGGAILATRQVTPATLAAARR